MKTIFTMINLVGGILVLLLGVAAVLNETRSPFAAVVGGVAVALAAICFWLANEYASNSPNDMA
jgi:hypothetical protein